MNEVIERVEGSAVLIPQDDIDTDRIIPASFMKCVTFDGLGDFVFYDARFEADGSPKDHPLNEARFSGASIVVSGQNFGCGSSREHAPQSIKRAGFKGIIAGSYAEIFFGNCVGLGIPCVCLSEADLADLNRLVDAEPSSNVIIDLASRRVRVGEWEATALVPEAARSAMMSGRWDPLGELIEARASVDRVRRALPYIGW